MGTVIEPRMAHLTVEPLSVHPIDPETRTMGALQPKTFFPNGILPIEGRDKGGRRNKQENRFSGDNIKDNLRDAVQLLYRFTT